MFYTTAQKIAGVNGLDVWVISGIRGSVSAWAYEYTYYVEYLAGGAFDGIRRYRDHFIGDDHTNVFQTTGGGVDLLKGGGGNDIYHLGSGAGYDRIEEIWRDSDFGGDGNDVIKVARASALSG